MCEGASKQSPDLKNTVPGEDHWAHPNQTWHNTSSGEGNSSLLN